MTIRRLLITLGVLAALVISSTTAMATTYHSQKARAHTAAHGASKLKESTSHGSHAKKSKSHAHGRGHAHAQNKHATPTATITGTAATGTPSVTGTPTVTVTGTPQASVTGTVLATAAASVTATCMPGNGFGDTNHCHSGPPGHNN
jgi:hypothetical protein